MSGKETAVNVLIGTMLLSAFALFVAAYMGAIGLAFYGVNLAAKHLFPGLDRASDIEFYGFACLAALLWSVQHLRKRLWPNAFLSFAIVVAITLIGLADLHSGRGHNGFFFLAWPLFLLLVMPLEHPLRRWEFVLGAIFVSAGVAATTGMLGSTAIARYVPNGVVLGVFAWFIVNTRLGRLPGQSAPASPATHA